MQWGNTLLRGQHSKRLMPEGSAGCCLLKLNMYCNAKAKKAVSAALQQFTCDSHALAMQESLAEQVLEHSRDATNL